MNLEQKILLDQNLDYKLKMIDDHHVIKSLYPNLNEKINNYLIFCCSLTDVIGTEKVR